jgi:hypothetical protein
MRYSMASIVVMYKVKARGHPSPINRKGLNALDLTQLMEMHVDASIISVPVTFPN